MENGMSVWKSSPEYISLDKNEIHIWYADLHSNEKELCRMKGFLSEKEAERASKYVFPSDKDKFIIGRAILRILLGLYLNKDPRQIEFNYTIYGKPEVGNRQINFNLSHSGSRALFAFSSTAEIGIDIEKIRNDFDELELAERFFSPGEITELKLVPASLRKRAFFNCWTRKEAFIKALGKGLSVDLDSFSVPVLPFYSDEFLPVKTGLEEDNFWRLKILQAGEDYPAAIALSAATEELKLYRWSNYDRISKT